MAQEVHQKAALNLYEPKCGQLLPFKDTLRLDERVFVKELGDGVQFVLEDLEIGISE